MSGTHHSSFVVVSKKRKKSQTQNQHWGGGGGAPNTYHKKKKKRQGLRGASAQGNPQKWLGVGMICVAKKKCEMGTAMANSALARVKGQGMQL